ncbi:MAG: hypothetical protein EXS31_01490 [Pedosphaera sp.]|nr:hypothetical protein [Pedosphaera sp.]
MDTKPNLSPNLTNSISSIYHVPLAKWLNEAGMTAPPAFFVPPDEAAEQFVKSVLDGEEGKKRVREWSVSDYGARFTGVLERELKNRAIAEDGEADCVRRMEQERAARDRLDQDLIITTTQYYVPEGVRNFVGLLSIGLKKQTQ